MCDLDLKVQVKEKFCGRKLQGSVSSYCKTKRKADATFASLPNYNKSGKSLNQENAENRIKNAISIKLKEF